MWIAIAAFYLLTSVWSITAYAWKATQYEEVKTELENLRRHVDSGKADVETLYRAALAQIRREEYRWRS